MADAGYRCFAPDWIGFGFSDKPQPGYGFLYTGLWKLWMMVYLFNVSTNVTVLCETEEEYHAELDRLLATLDINSPFFLVVQVLNNHLIFFFQSSNYSFFSTLQYCSHSLIV